MISRTAEYALRAVIYLAADGVNAPQTQTVAQIARATQVPVTYLAKVLQSLTRTGLLISQRGSEGGFRLAKAAQETSIYEVVQAVDPLQRIHECPLGLEAHGTQLCPLHHRLDEAMSLIEVQFRNTTIAELLNPVGGQLPATSRQHLCVFPSPQPPAAVARHPRTKAR